jgi:hypothetical protein
VFVRVPRTVPLDLAVWQIESQLGRGVALLHFLVYRYDGERLGEFAAEAGRVIESRGCLDLGPVDRDRRQLIASASSRLSRRFMPAGVALRLAPAPATPGGSPDGIGILLDGEWANGSPRPRRASARVVLKAARAGTVRRIATPIFERSAELALEVAPGTIASTEGGVPAVWRPAAPEGACVLDVSGHMHKRGRFFGVDRLASDGSVQNPPAGPPNPFETGRRHLFAALDFTDPGTLTPPTPLFIGPGEGLRYACWDDNGVTRAVRLGCEEEGGGPPGRALGAPGGGSAKPCAQPGPAAPECPVFDPERPDRRFTGACVAANLVAGTSPDDEICALVGAAFDPLAGAPPGSECDAAANSGLRPASTAR